MSGHMPSEGNLPKEKAKPSHHEAEAHQGQSGSHPSKESPLGCKSNPRVLGLCRLVVHWIAHFRRHGLLLLPPSKPGKLYGLALAKEFCQQERRRCCQSADNDGLPCTAERLLHGEPPFDVTEHPKGKQRDDHGNDQGRMDRAKTKYGARGIMPPAIYEPAMVNALRLARFGSGFSKPNSNFIMKSTHRF